MQSLAKCGAFLYLLTPRKPISPHLAGFFYAYEYIMDYQLITIVVAILSSAGAIVWQASRIKTTVDVHGDAIGEHKRRLDAHEALHKEHIKKIATLEGRDSRK